MRNIIASLYKNPIVHTVDIIDIIEEPEIQLLYAKLTLIDKTLLYIREVITSKDDKYSYHWQTESGRMIRRWDNAPHWQQKIGALHHVHTEMPEVAEPSSRVTIEEILETIAEIIKKKRRKN